MSHDIFTGNRGLQGIVESLVLDEDENKSGTVETVQPPEFGGFEESEGQQQSAVSKWNSPGKQ